MADNEYPFSNWRSTVEGNIATDPKNIAGKGKNSCVVFRLAVQNRTEQHGEHSFFLNIKVFGGTADNVLASYAKGARVMVEGKIESHEYNDEDQLTLVADMVGGSNRWNTVTLDKPEGGSRSNRRADDDDEDDKPARGRSRRRDDDDEQEEEERPARRRRSDDDDDEDERPSRGRGRGRSRDDDDEDADDRPARGRGRGRSRDDDDEPDEDDRPSRRRGRSRRDDDD